MPLKIDRIVLGPHCARELQKRVSDQFLEYFESNRPKGPGAYLLGQWEGANAAKD